MKKFLLAAVAVAALGVGAAGAADMQVKAAMPPAPGCAQFGGLYVGGNVGWAAHDTTWVDGDDWIDNFSNDFNSSSISRTHSGVTGGLQAGYNWQRHCTVYGFEIDGSWAGLSNTTAYTPAPAGGTTLTINDSLRSWGTARTRAGVVVDDLLLYATGGVAYASIKHTWTVTDPNSLAESFSAESGRWGAVAGVGVEWAVSSNWSLKSEALYIRFSEKSTTGFSPAGNQAVTFFSQDAMWVARFGANYRFGAR